MSDHDELCPVAAQTHPYVGARCACHLIRRVRTSEDEKIAQAIEAERDLYERVPFEVDNFNDCAQIARNGGK